ncbi:DNA polymerase III subunit epsilon [Candidatus Venteria ishoeyi]|uniref:DNA polymerase III subunit epsilon n=1 Tax=Candidatus Venteria ishoeyi TaxID=1899563 RepID=A0A1H6F5H4_9GAMM|nr:DNA polymerase III subunit epsilon [Candidatus Venteria ishoeyi]MDM8548180.1 DNA polymerase III subunit epsilon [Candidatus Venteria ishoeyi]SEH04234.1 DNA polymerase III subunit epsilon [Candidatus Venteria ishoeyi]
MRQVILDTETTGLAPSEGHRLIEIAAIELIDRETTGIQFHHYLQPHHPVDEKALAIHGLSDEFLTDKPDFSSIAAEFMAFIKGTQLIIHNAAFDLSFLDQELGQLEQPLGRIERYCDIIDTLALARSLYPGKDNSLESLCKRYHIDTTCRSAHGALIDAQLLTEVYLAMTDAV